MAKEKYIEAKKRVKELYFIVPLINSRFALRVLQQGDLPKDEIPTNHMTIQKWFDQFEKVSDRIRQENLIRYIYEDNPILNQRSKKQK